MVHEKEKALLRRVGLGKHCVALETDLRRERSRQFGGLPISSGNCYGAFILCIGDWVNHWLAQATQRSRTMESIANAYKRVKGRRELSLTARAHFVTLCGACFEAPNAPRAYPGSVSGVFYGSPRRED